MFTCFKLDLSVCNYKCDFIYFDHLPVFLVDRKLSLNHNGRSCTHNFVDDLGAMGVYFPLFVDERKGIFKNIVDEVGENQRSTRL